MRAELTSSTPTISALLGAGRALFGRAEASPRLDAEVLLGHVLGQNRVWLMTHGDSGVTAGQAERFLEMIRARKAGQPVAQLTGQREFWSLILRVTPDVLTPRPDTELLVECALGLREHRQPARVLDLGTGSGAVALALAVERPDWAIVATDISAAALEVAAGNARAAGISNILMIQGDWLAAVPGQRFDMIVANPPYLADHEWAESDPELQFEPRQALAGGVDGLEAIRVIAAGAPAHLLPGGWLLLEHGMRQGESIRALLRESGYQEIRTSRDLAGLPRITQGRHAGACERAAATLLK